MAAKALFRCRQFWSLFGLYLVFSLYLRKKFQHRSEIVWVAKKLWNDKFWVISERFFVLFF